jgi:SAM-dependent methyltransferase
MTTASILERRPDVKSAFAAILAEDGHENFEGFLNSYDQYFSGVPLDGRRILDVGSGKGHLSLYMALRGGIVTSMEPEMWGSTPGASSLQDGRARRLGVELRFLNADFNTWDPGGQRFDVIVLENCINHLYESPYSAMSHAPTFAAYETIARKLHLLLTPGGVAVASDASRYAFFTMTKKWGMRRPWNWTPTSINWRVHQNAGTWVKIFRSAGFSRTRIDYPLPRALRPLGPLVQNPLTNFFLHGRFVLKAWR